MFADDTTLHTPDKSITVISKRLQKGLQDVSDCLDMLEIMTLLNNTVGQLPEDSEGTIQKQAPIAMTTLPEDSEGTIQKQAPIAMTTLRKKVIFEGFSLPRSLIIDDEKRTHDEDRIVELRYRPKYPGQYAVHVLWDGEDIPDSPFMVNIEPAAAFQAEKVDAWGPGLKSDGVVAGKRVAAKRKPRTAFSWAHLGEVEEATARGRLLTSCRCGVGVLAGPGSTKVLAVAVEVLGPGLVFAGFAAEVSWPGLILCRLMLGVQA
nr:hypothetical protein BaRGS_033068 [Batillaria attramentaria]